MVPIALWVDRPWDQVWSFEAVATVAWLGVFATGLATIVYFRVVQSAGPTFLSLMNYLIPVVALTAGAVVLDEEPAGTILIGLVLILTGLAISQLGGRSRPAR